MMKMSCAEQGRRCLARSKVRYIDTHTSIRINIILADLEPVNKRYRKRSYTRRAVILLGGI